MNQSFIGYTSESVKKLIQSPLLSQIISSGAKFFTQNKTQLIVTAGLITALAIMSKPSDQIAIPDKPKLEINLQGSGLNGKKGMHRDGSAKQSPKSSEVTNKPPSSKHHINDDLKKSWRQLNRRINRTMKKRGLVGGYKCDQTFDEQSSDEGQVISPNFSIVSDVDQKFYADHAKKLKPKRNYQTDNDSDNCLTFLNQKKNHMLKLAQEQKDGTDKLFFKLYAQVADLGIPEDDEDD